MAPAGAGVGLVAGALVATAAVGASVGVGVSSPRRQAVRARKSRKMSRSLVALIARMAGHFSWDRSLAVPLDMEWKWVATGSCRPTLFIELGIQVQGMPLGDIPHDITIAECRAITIPRW